ncbi:MAG: hypothetical protein ACOWYE_15910 [Desulfatiglandales bacterium]
MKVLVKLYGTLSRGFPGYRHSQGMEIDIPDGARVKNLLAHLAIPESQGACIAVKGLILKAGEKVPGGVDVQVLQTISGG